MELVNNDSLNVYPNNIPKFRTDFLPEQNFWKEKRGFFWKSRSLFVAKCYWQEHYNHIWKFKERLMNVVYVYK